ncbi:hypothetical protein MUN82_06815 [Hymenobacter aerilatus]|uniref:Uncharacterized protein n=1 Tax=Hymenobacter aerilatus TaxID=2932251 RepID=A0A8T9SXJ5_9BACT|nr:hypothetical protein [Hymenobacter aerilatus]UOR06808.1 hypothetical protein MUN82_06815 [Hymenobacter aerilatus]
MTRFPIPFYLNQKYVFDILAMIEDGFTKIQTLKTITSSNNEFSQKAQGEVGLNNVFSFLGIKMSAEAGKQQKLGNETSAETQKVHTPNSLFGKMQALLDNQGIICKESIMNSSTGDFVLFKATLRKNPVVSTLENYLALFKLASNFTEESAHSKQQKSNNQKNDKLLKQFKLLVNELKVEGSLDLAGESVGSEIFQAVLTIDRDYLNDPSLSDIADGEFFILGKTIKIINSADDGINLLRKTSLSNVSQSMLDSIFSGFQNLAQHGLNDANIVTIIKGPVIQIVPIAIYA